MVIACLIHTLSTLSNNLLQCDTQSFVCVHFFFCLSFTFCLGCSLYEAFCLLHPLWLSCLFGGLPDEGGGWLRVRGRQEVRRPLLWAEGEGSVGGGAENWEGGGSCTWIECVRSMWERCQPQLHSRSEFKVCPFMLLFFPFYSLLPPSPGIKWLWIFLGVMGGWVFAQRSKCEGFFLCVYVTGMSFWLWRNLLELTLTFDWQKGRLDYHSVSWVWKDSVKGGHLKNHL